MIFPDRTIHHGAPADFSDRDEQEQRVYRFLETLPVSYDRVDHLPSLTTEDNAERAELLGVRICKNIFLSNAHRTRFVFLIMPADKRYVTRIFSKAIGYPRMGFAPEEMMTEQLGCTSGHASVFALLNDPEGKIPVYVDEEVLEQEYFACHPCRNTSTLRFRTADLTGILFPALGHTFTPVRIPEEETAE